jgi:3-hydroxyacyl-[acyl-carrier-protein] dehydratase
VPAIDYPRILDLIPVRHPILLVDRVVSLTPGERIETVKAVSGSEPCFASLAEGLPAHRYAFPRSLIVESLGQSAALLWLGSEHDPGERVDWVPMAGRLRRCRFLGDAFPGDLIRHTVRLHAVVDASTAFMSGESRVDDRILCTVGSLIAVRRPRETIEGCSASRVPAGHPGDGEPAEITLLVDGESR